MLRIHTLGCLTVPFNEEDDELIDPPPDALVGGASISEDRQLDALLLDVYCDLSRLAVLLSEMDEAEGSRLAERIKRVKRAARALPACGVKPSRKVGFKP